MSRTADHTAKISLLRAAEEVFAEKGLQLAKVEEITKRAGHSKGAFYLHFESKEEAFKQVVESFLARLAANVVAPPDAVALPESLADQLRAGLEVDEQTYEFLWQNRAIVGIVQGCAQGEFSYLLEAFQETIIERSKEWIRHSKRIGSYRADLDDELAATLLCGAHSQLCQKLVTSPKKPPIRDWLRAVQSVFVRGFGTPRLVTALEDIERENPPVSRSIEAAAGTHTVGSTARGGRRRHAKVG